MKLGSLAQTHQYNNGKVRDGTPQYVSSSCENRGGCEWCEGNRKHSNRKREPIVEN